jgi:16S rRNA (cytidine1402-2'-O)-methyltransferase
MTLKSSKPQLFIVATPIGNLSDISLRVKQSLDDCDFILAEDTRVSVKLLNHLGLKKRMFSCHDFNESSRLAMLSQAYGEGKSVALMSDAGTPLISDPGFQIVREAIALGMQITPIPGPSAFILALVASGLPCDRFIFEGFLPEKSTLLKARLQELSTETRTLIFYVSPHKLCKTLSYVYEIFGERQACMAREMTKLHEEFLRKNLSELLKDLKDTKIMGECVLVVAGADKEDHCHEATELEVLAAVRDLRAKGLGVKEISVECAKRLGWKRSRVYELALSLFKEKHEQ